METLPRISRQQEVTCSRSPWWSWMGEVLVGVGSLGDVSTWDQKEEQEKGYNENTEGEGEGT